jgi:hypothetical protein
MPQYTTETVLARYGKILAATPEDPEEDDTDLYLPCGGHAGEGQGAEVQGCSLDGGCAGCCMSLVATVAAAAGEKAVEVPVADTMAMAEGLWPVPASGVGSVAPCPPKKLS